MYEFFRKKPELLRQAQTLAEMHLADLVHQRSDISLADAAPFLTQQILRLNRYGESDAEHLADQAIGLLREHIQKRESAQRLRCDPD